MINVIPYIDIGYNIDIVFIDNNLQISIIEKLIKSENARSGSRQNNCRRWVWRLAGAMAPPSEDAITVFIPSRAG